MYILFNPSTGKEGRPDPTIRNLQYLTENAFKQEFGGKTLNCFTILNLFAFVTPKPSELKNRLTEKLQEHDGNGEKALNYIVGKDNTLKLFKEHIRKSKFIVVGWGNINLGPAWSDEFDARKLEIKDYLGFTNTKTGYFGLTGKNNPKHPLFQATPSLLKNAKFIREVPKDWDF